MVQTNITYVHTLFIIKFALTFLHYVSFLHYVYVMHILRLSRSLAGSEDMYESFFFLFFFSLFFLRADKNSSVTLAND